MNETDINDHAGACRRAVVDGARRRLDARQGGRSIVKFISAEIDALVQMLWQRIAGPLGERMDLVAVGGYGRAELCPHSDLDLLFLVPRAPDAAIDAAIRRFLQVLWDSGATVGHGIRTPAQTRDFAAVNHHARTSLLDARLLAGSGRLFAQVRKDCSPQHWSRRQRVDFCVQKLEECAKRRREVGDTAFCMEPDVKKGKGGLRDTSTIFWLSEAWYGVPNARELIGQGVVSEDEFNGFVRARDFLWRVRCGLHLLAGREEDRLLFEYQQELASRFRYRDSRKSRGVERFLKNYFLNVRAIADLSDIFLLHFEEQVHPPKRTGRPRNLGGGMVVQSQKISVHDANAFAADPVNLLRIFVEAQKEHRYLNSGALRVVRKHARLVNAALRADSEANALFLCILRSPRNVATALGQMHETGVLGRFIPDFGRITGHGQFDRYHSYTVDAHTIRAIDILRDFRLGEGQFIEMPLAQKLMPELERPELLYLALLYHDIAKGRGVDHSELGEQLARRFCLRLGLSQDDVELVAWLVRHHLALSKAAQHYDLSDPGVIADFARFVGDHERLVYLFVLTVADVAAVGPGIWTDWKGALFTQLFHAADACLRSGEVTPSDQEERIGARRESVLALCEEAERPAVARALDALSRTLALHFPPAFLLRLCRLLDAPSGVHIEVKESLGHTQVLAWGGDRPKLFAHLTAALANANTKVLTAHAYALRDGRVLDEFHICDAHNSPALEADHLERLRRRLQGVLAGGVPAPIRRTAKPDVLMQALPVGVRRLEAAARSITAIEVVAADRRGLLASLAESIAGTGVELRGANVSTFGEKAVDVFFLTDASGRKLGDAQTELLIERLREAAELPRD